MSGSSSARATVTGEPVTPDGRRHRGAAELSRWATTMRHRRQTRQAYRLTLEELLLAAIIVSLATAVVLAWAREARPWARLNTCRRQLGRLGEAINLYRADFNDQLPPWLSVLHPKYVRDQRTFLCPSDKHKGMEGGTPSWFRGSQFAETDDHANCTSGDGPGEVVRYGDAYVKPKEVRNAAVRGVSYHYNFCMSRCSWWADAGRPKFPDVVCGNSDGVVSRREAMMVDVRGLSEDPAAPDTKAVADPEYATGDGTHMVRCLWRPPLRRVPRSELLGFLTLALDGQHVYALPGR